MTCERRAPAHDPARRRSPAVRAARWLAACALALALPGAALAGWGELNLPVGATELSDDVYALHMRIFWICVAIGVAVFGVMIVSMFLHRKSRGVTASNFHESTKVEIAWTVVPLLILITMAVPAARVLIEMEDFSDSELSIKVTGYQWRWHYDYLDEGVAFYSALDPEQDRARQLDADIALEQFGDAYLREVDNELVVPTDTKIRFLNTSADVIHSWWVQDFALKKDAIPGFINENWATIEEPGVYRGKCAELCGRDHGFMPIVVRAVPPAEFESWLAEQKEAQVAAVDESMREWGHDELMARGEAVYGTSCVGCHQAEGQGIPNLFPAIAASAVATGDVGAHLSTVVHGVDGTAMSAFSSALTDAEIAAVVTYQRNAFGNATGDTVQPADARAARLASPASDDDGPVATAPVSPAAPPADAAPVPGPAASPERVAVAAPDLDLELDLPGAAAR